MLGPVLWFGGAAGEKIPTLGEKIARHTKPNAMRSWRYDCRIRERIRHGKAIVPVIVIAIVGIVLTEIVVHLECYLFR